MKFVLVGVAVAAACVLVPARLRWIGYVVVSILALAAAALVTQVPASHALLFFVHA